MMPHPSKRQKLTVTETDLAYATVADQIVVTSGDLSVDVLANTFGYLGMQDIMQKRCVCKKWKEAATKTVVPPTNFRIDSVEKHNAMGVMTRALPNLQQVAIFGLGRVHKYNDGEDPNEEEAARTADRVSHNIEIISNFSKLRILKISTSQSLNGRYPFLFNSFPLLQKLSLHWCYHLKWDLEMLAGMPFLKELDCESNRCLTGNINSLGVLKDTIEKVHIENSKLLEGNFMDLADFPNLEELALRCTAVTGDIRDIGDDDFSSLGQLKLPKGVYGGKGYEFQRIADAHDIVRAVYLLNKQRPDLKMMGICGRLSQVSPEWYASDDYDDDSPPFFISFVKAGSRLGYRWKTNHGRPCEVNWLDPEPDRESSDYDEYIEELQEIERNVNNMYRGFHQPPPEEEYHRLLEEYR